MRLPLLFIIIVFISCGQSSPGKQETSDSLKKSTGTTGPQKKQPADSSGNKPTSLAKQVNSILNDQPGNKWHVLNDREGRWMSGQFDYFIAPKRKENPDYPYIAKGDFNGDGKLDIAALVTDSTKRNYQLAIILNADEVTRKIVSWKEDIDEDAAIALLPKSEVEGFEGERPKKIKMKADGILVEYFETASFVIYWNGSAFKRIQTGD